MRILVVGAGAVGGYFGGRLLEAKRDVTFLVRARRAAELAASGLIIRSPLGDATLLSPPTLMKEQLSDSLDLVLLSCKAFDLDDAITSFAPAVGPTTVILPLLNGMRHLDTLDDRFGPDRVLGGQCVIASTLAATSSGNREIVHLNDVQALSFGERDGSMSQRVQQIGELMTGVRFGARASTAILLDMWEKWVFLATLAGATCLMRANVGDICSAPGGADLLLNLFRECCSIAESQGYAPREAFLDRTRKMLSAPDSKLTASMLRDIESAGPIEADHIIGDLIQRARGRDALSLLPIVYTHLKAYESRRRRES
jgi:2-dehydropantoate 2-reductase